MNRWRAVEKPSSSSWLWTHYAPPTGSTEFTSALLRDCCRLKVREQLHMPRPLHPTLHPRRGPPPQLVGALDITLSTLLAMRRVSQVMLSMLTRGKDLDIQITLGERGAHWLPPKPTYSSYLKQGWYSDMSRRAVLWLTTYNCINHIRDNNIYDSKSSAAPLPLPLMFHFLWVTKYDSSAVMLAAYNNYVNVNLVVF